MYVIVANKFMRSWLNKNLAKYEVTPPNSNVFKCYKNKDFELLLYKTNTLTISGSIRDRVYNKLISVCNEIDYIGCDEVGVGDFFGPVVYTAVYLDQKSIDTLANSYINIKDSKKCTDEEIFHIYDTIKDTINFKTEVVYDKDVDDLNSIAQKSYYHYQNITKFDDLHVDKTVIDLFTTEKSFYKYAKDLNLNFSDNLILETKADSKFISVALSSIISRAIFLEEIQKIEDKYKMPIPKGSSNISGAINQFLSLYSKEELANVCKTSFKTFKEL